MRKAYQVYDGILQEFEVDRLRGDEMDELIFEDLVSIIMRLQRRIDTLENFLELKFPVKCPVEGFHEQCERAGFDPLEPDGIWKGKP